MRKVKELSKRAAMLRNAALAASLCVAAVAPAHAEGTAFVHLFEWKWNDIAAECESFLGPKGYDAVQISPPNEHVNFHTWWARYQPVSFTNLTSRSGTEAELHSMIQRCHAKGVKIIADVVLNNWANNLDGGNTGSGGSTWTPRNYPGLSPRDFHQPSCTISYGNANSVWDCELYNMPDLNTGAAYPQQYAATYMKKLKAMGVDGFRIDAGKHIRPSELGAILAQAGNPWNFIEVIGAGGEAAEIQPGKYTQYGLVTEFAFGPAVASNFKGQIKNLKTLGSGWGLLNSANAVSFIDNHDRERGHGGGGNFTYKDGARYNLANVYMLAFPYGYPSVMSGYNFTDTDAGPPGAGGCANSAWTCQHRWANIANMVGFRNYTKGAWTVDRWWDNGNNQIAFGRGSAGFVVINNESTGLYQTLQTGMPAGDYCNILAGAEACSGSMVRVDGNGYATFSVGAMAAAAIHGGAKGGACAGCFKQVFPSLNLRGTPNGWASLPMALVADNTWEASVNFDGQAQQRFKFDVSGNWSVNYGDNGNDGVLDQTGADIATAVVGQYQVRVNDQTLAYTLTRLAGTAKR
ncbi:MULTISPECIES: alpha amylase C-terminal domain-containing protein [unclassified Janthinobacterium]|uniref:alpha amylase C-terminal domain-containing protein n=1 Tax=unclassified Janthinobacterium TaxID=2610881 RepID=UPI0009D9BA7F|nr:MULTISPECIES: alpha amylase C-terminal domain-containing protein [unclassified Janthinobacterium]MEC5163239.1 alpha-amylase [Janthinobacterium sp. CG_S6]